MPKHKFKPIEAIGKLVSAPITKRAAGYGFVLLEGDVNVYCSADLVRSAGVTAEDISRDARVVYHKLGDGRFAATRLTILRDGGTDDQLVEMYGKLTDAFDDLDEQLDAFHVIMVSRGLIPPT